MSNKHKNPTISFRVSDYERKAIEARILTSGLLKKDYFVRSCINNRICVVGKKETIYPIVDNIRKLYNHLCSMHSTFTNDTADAHPTSVEISNLKTEYELTLKAIIDLLDGAKYLWEGVPHI
ncbi:MAG: plasmid mobilization protein [Mobilitalea sp.]